MQNIIAIDLLYEFTFTDSHEFQIITLPFTMQLYYKSRSLFYAPGHVKCFLVALNQHELQLEDWGVIVSPLSRLSHLQPGCC